MLDQPLTAGTIQACFETSLVAGGHSAGQAHRCEEGTAVGEACFWTGALRGRSPCTREAACGRPPKYASTTGDACEMSCAMGRPPAFQVASCVFTRLNCGLECEKLGSISVANAPELVQRRAILLGIDLFSLQMAVSLPDNTLKYRTPPAEKLVSRGAQEVYIVYIIQK